MEDLSIPKRVSDTVEAIHNAHEELLILKTFKKQSSCQHSNFSYAHPQILDSCRLCAIEACNIRRCKECKKEF